MDSAPKEANAEALTPLTSDYGNPPDAHKVAKEINSQALLPGQLLHSCGKLKELALQ